VREGFFASSEWAIFRLGNACSRPFVRTDPVPAAWIDAIAHAAAAEVAGRSVTSAAGRLAAAVLGAMTRARHLKLATILVVGAGAAIACTAVSGRGDGPTTAAQAKPGASGKAADPAAKSSGRITGRVVSSAEGNTAGGAEVILLLPPPKGQDGYTDSTDIGVDGCAARPGRDETGRIQEMRTPRYHAELRARSIALETIVPVQVSSK
jgi:hypothetical protein